MTRLKETAKGCLSIFMMVTGIIHLIDSSLLRPRLLSSTEDSVIYIIGIVQILIGTAILRSAYTSFSARHNPESELTPLAISNLLQDTERSNLLVYETTDNEGGRVTAIFLQRQETIDVSTARLLSRHKGDLGLQVRSITDDIARVLGKHSGGRLLLNFLTEISDSATESLSQHRGELWLRGLCSISDASARSLSKHQYGSLRLKSLEFLSDEATRHLAKHPDVELDLSILPKSACAILRDNGYQDE